MLRVIGLCMTVWLLRADCFQFDDSFGDSTIRANASGEAVIAFRYIEQTEDRSKTKIECGYIDDNSDIQNLVIKEGLSIPRRIGGTNIANRVEVYTGDAQSSNVIGMKITRIEKTDPVEYKCSAGFTVGQDPVKIVSTKKKTLVVLDRPRFINCLNGLPIVTAGQELDFTCTVYGNPTPLLKCEVVSYRGHVLQDLPRNTRDGEQRNFTQSTFVSISKEADSVRCIATNEYTGVEVLSRRLTVRHSPFKPQNFTQINSVDSNSVTMRWRRIPQNETGEDFDGYKVYWYTEGQNPNTNTTHRTLPIQPNGIFPNFKEVRENDVTYFEYSLRDLNPRSQYKVWVVGFNNLGDGDLTIQELMIPGLNPFSAPSTGGDDDSNLPLIIGCVVAGVVVLVLIVLLVVWLSRRSTPSTSKYPTSYVEDAVDYPPNQGHSLYADVGKGSRNNSSSNYPDVVNDYNNGYASRNTAGTFEQSDKAYV